MKIVLVAAAAFAGLLSALIAHQPPLAGVLLVACATGLCVGSFINVVVWRLPRMLQHEADSAAREHLGLPVPDRTRFDLSHPRSHCPHCKATLGARDLVPVASWIALRARCRRCAVPISVRYPLVELACGALSVVTVAVLGVTPMALVGLGVVWVSLAAALVDADTQLLPDELTNPLLWGLLLAAAFGFGRQSAHEALIGAALGYGSAALLAKGGAMLLGRESLGEGDWKYLAAAGALLGAAALPWVWVLASTSALAWALVRMGRASAVPTAPESAPMPFGPHLVLATVGLMLAGPHLSQWLTSQGLAGF